MREMNNNILMALITALLMLNWAICFNILDTVEKNSVHPLYGNYKKFNSDLEKCSPWESCE